MIIRTPTYTIKHTKEDGLYVAKGGGIVGYGKTPEDAVCEWISVWKMLDEVCVGGGQ